MTDHTELQVKAATDKRAVMLAYGHLWHIRNEGPGPMRYPEDAANAARAVLRDQLTRDEMEAAINEVGRLIGRYETPKEPQ